MKFLRSLAALLCLMPAAAWAQGAKSPPGLPVSGGTLTGPLNGTSGSFSGPVLAGTVLGYASLRAMPGATARQSVRLSGCTKLDDGCQGTFSWIPGSTLSDDGGTVFAATGGVWQREGMKLTAQGNNTTYSPVQFDPRWFGAVMDNSSDDTAAFQALLNSIAANYDSANAGVVVNLPPGNIKTRALTPHRAIYWRGSGYRTTVWNYTGNTAAPLMALNVDGNIFDGIQFGNITANLTTPLFTLAAGNRAEFRNTFNEMSSGFIQSSGALYLENFFSFANSSAQTPATMPVIDIQGGTANGRNVSCNIDVSTPAPASMLCARVQGGIFSFDDVFASNMAGAVEISPQSGQIVTFVRIDNLRGAGSGGTAVSIAPAAGGIVRQVDITSPEIIGAVGDGIAVAGSGTVGSVNVSGGQVAQAVNGVHVTNADRFTVNGTSVAQNSADGLLFDGSVSNFGVFNVLSGAGTGRTGNTGYGIHIAGTTHAGYVIAGCKCKSNTAGDFLDETTSIGVFRSVAGVATTNSVINDTHLPSATPSTFGTDDATAALRVAGTQPGIEFQDKTAADPNVRLRADGGFFFAEADPAKTGTFNVPLFRARYTASAINTLTIQPSVSGNSTGVQLFPYSVGSDTNISIALLGAGTGTLNLGSTTSPINLRGAQFDQSKGTPAVPTSGSTVTVGTNQGIVILAPAADLSALTVALPTPLDGRKVKVATTRAITTLSVTGSSTTVIGAPTTLAANASFEMIYDSSTTSWYRIQ